MQKIYKLLSEALDNKKIKDVIKFSLDGAPEIKHEGMISTLISAYLREQGIVSRREVSSQYLKISNENRRYDLIVENERIEAKYNFEGDLLEISKDFKRVKEIDLVKRNTAYKSIYKEVSRGIDSYFLWHICIRRNLINDTYKCEDLIKNYYNKLSIQNISDCYAIDYAKKIIEGEIYGNFKSINEKIKIQGLPSIEGKNDTILSYLYSF